MVLSGWRVRGISVGVDDPVECTNLVAVSEPCRGVRTLSRCPNLVAVSVEEADEVAAVLVAEGDGHILRGHQLVAWAQA
jgi:hypothetical protein